MPIEDALLSAAQFLVISPMGTPEFRHDHLSSKAKTIVKDEKLSFILQKTDEKIGHKNNQ